MNNLKFFYIACDGEGSALSDIHHSSKHLALKEIEKSRRFDDTTFYIEEHLDHAAPICTNRWRCDVDADYHLTCKKVRT